MGFGTGTCSLGQAGALHSPSTNPGFGTTTVGGVA